MTSSASLQGFRLSPHQEYLWLLEQGEGSPCLMQAVLRMEGEVSTQALSSALDEVVGRHEILRTTFQCLPGMSLPVQVIGDDAGVQIADVNLRGLDEDARAARLREILAADGRAPFDLAQGPVLRLHRLRLAQTSWLLVLTLPSLCADAASMSCLAGEIGREYGAALGLAGTAAPEAMQYADFSEWIHQLNASDGEREGREHWHRQVIPCGSAAPLPFERIAPLATPFLPEAVPVFVASDVVQSLRRLAGGGAAGWSRLLLASWQTLLWRLSGEGEVIVRVAFDGRRYEELRNAVGCFARHLPVVARPDAGDRFDELLRRTGERLAESARWQEYFDWNAVAANDTPAWQIVPAGFELFEAAAETRAAGAVFRLERLRACSDRFKLKLSCALVAAEPSLQIEFDANLFEPSDVETLSRSLGALLEAVARRPDRPLAELDIVGPEERSRLIVELNRTGADFPGDLCVHGLFERQVETTPERLAAQEGERALDYAELNARANQLAWFLVRQGVGPEVRVAVSSVRTLETLVAMLAVLKAGGAYLPIEPRHPRERLAQVLADARPRLLLCTGGAGEEQGEIPVLRVSLDDWIAANESTRNPERSAVPESLAYVLFTSGTTGRPKGVMVPHRGLVNYLSWCLRAYGVEEGWGSPVHSPIGFDLTVTSLFSPLLAGRAVWLLPDAPGAGSLGAALRERGGFGLVKLTPAHLEMLVPELEACGPAGRARTLVIGGEALRAESLALWRERAPETRLINEYGPTEAVVGCCVHEVRPGDPAEGAVPIGRPIINTSLFVLDPRMQPVPAGIVGELYIGGKGVVRGYMARPEVTAAAFVPDPYGESPGARLYRTGDLVRHLPGGHLEFVGRHDGQVKIRGYRVELGEVEAALCRHFGIAEAVVLVREGRAGDRRLAAFFVPAGQPAPAEDDLATYLRDRLPEWMVPSTLRAIPVLPLTPNGKIDRVALLAAEQGERPQRGTAAPRTPTEELVAAVWCEVLGLDQVGIHDEFLALGGHSLVATRVLTRLRRIFALDLPFRLLMEASTVARVAARIDSELRTGKLAELPPIERVDRSGPLSLGFAQQRMWFLDRLAPGSPVYNIPGALLLAGEIDTGALQRAFGELVRRHEPLRTHFRVESGRPVQVIGPAKPFALPVIDLGALPEDGRDAYARRLVAEEVRRPFDLERGPLLRATLLRLRQSLHLLVFTVHHIVFDGWSAGILISEIGSLYSAFHDRQPSPLPELPVQYVDFTQWQSRWLQGEALSQLLAYWCARLARPLPVLDLVADRPRPPILGTRGGVLTFSLPHDLTASFQALSRRWGATLFMTALTVFKTFLSRCSGLDDVIVGTPVAGRDRVETEGMLGLLINTLALRTDLAGGPAFEEALLRVRETALQAHAHQDLPFERLVQELQPERDAGRTPIFQVLFALQNSPVQPLRLQELAITPLDVHTGTAKLDLSLAMSEVDGSLAASIEYAADLFDAATVARIPGQLRNLFAAAVSSSSLPITDLQLLTDFEAHQLIHEWNARRVAGAARGCLHHRFARRSVLAPNAIAVVAGEERLTYGELDRQSGRLARHLRSLGVRPESRVGICLERSPRMLVGLLGILKAGGAYVPLDPAYPAERIDFMLQDSGAGLVVTESAFADRFGAEKTTLLLMDEPEAEANPSEPLVDDGGAGEGNAAYVIYTSGSTGRPKGVVVTHGNVLRLFDATDAWFSFGANDVWTLFHSFAFDFSVWEIWGALLYGGRVVVVPYLVSRSPEAFYDLIQREGVTVLNQTPSAFRSLMQVAIRDADADLSLRWVIFGGEALEFAKLRPWMDSFGAGLPRLVNMYGITETTVHVTWRPLTDSDPHGTVSGAIGQAIPDLCIRLLDASGQPVPIGVAGELHVGGAGLARCYLGRPDLTAARFVPDPFGSPGERLYRTGDLARYRPNGDLEFLGRIDHQVKIRGFRIELGEIEAALTGHPGLREVAVAGFSENGETRLVAWVVPAQEPAPSTGELREFLRRRLPEYMLPSAFVPMAGLPVTPSGKVDRRALPLPGTDRLPAGTAFSAPSTPLEQALAEIWMQVLGLPGVGIDDNFFGLGGDSMRTLQVVSLAQEQGLSLELMDLYEFQAIRELAAHLAESREPAGDEAMLSELLQELDLLSDEEVQLRLAGGFQPDEEPAA